MNEFSSYDKNVGIKFQPFKYDEIALEDFEWYPVYQTLFFEIPKFGDINSHEYLIKTSQAYAGDFNNDDTIQALIEEVTQLRQENLDLQQQVIAIPTISTGSI